MSNNDFDIFAGDPDFTIFDEEESGLDSYEFSEETLDVDSIQFNPENVLYNKYDNEDEESLEELAEMIKLTGTTRINPISVIRMGPAGTKEYNQFKILAGERRYRAITEILHWKTADFLVFPYDTPKDVKVALFHGTNVTQRILKIDQLFNSYLEIVKASENNPTLKNLNKLSKKRKEQFEKILNNTSEEDIQRYQNKELTFSDLQSAVDEQLAEIARQKRINNAYMIYAQAQENADMKLYVDYDSTTVYYVDKSIDNNIEKYGVRQDNYDKRLPSSWVRSSELPRCDERKTMQLFLDKYAETHNLEELTEEEYATLMRKKEKKFESENDQTKNKKEKSSKKSNIFPDIIVSPDSIDDDIQEDVNLANSVKAQLIAEISENESEETSKKDHSKSDKTPKMQSEETNEPTLETNDDVSEQFDLLKNRYALEFLYEGKDIYNDSVRVGRLVINKELDRYFIIENDVTVDEELEVDDGFVFALSCVAYEVIPTTIIAHKS